MNSEIRKGIVGVPRIASSMSGFTLVEIAVVLVILALLLATVLGPLATRLEAEERQRAQDELSEIKEAILGFAVSNGRMPCPDIDGDGAEDRTAGACTDPIGNTYVIAGLPWQTLGVDREDPWTNNYLYGVTKSFADNPPSGTTGTCTTAAALSSFNLCDPGNIIINDENGTLVATVPAIVVSPGKNRNSAALTVSGALSAFEAENADGDDIFVSKNFSRDATLEFDDLVVWTSPNILKNRMVVAGRLP